MHFTVIRNCGRCIVLDSKALTKIQSAALITIIVVAAVGGSAAYFLWSGKTQPTESVKIGVCGDLDNIFGKATWRGAVLAAEQINAEGGVLGRNLTIVAEDDGSETPPVDIAVASNALTKLITVDKADYIVTSSGSNTLVFQDIAAEHKKILLSVVSGGEAVQRVLDNYDRYKYFFSIFPPNDTVIRHNLVGSLMTLKNYTGFTKVALLFQDVPAFKETESTLSSTLPQYGFDIVYSGTVLVSVTDFTSQFAAIEASGAEILVPSIVTQAGIFFVKEWAERQSPFVVLGIIPMAVTSNSWNLMGGKCEFVSSNVLPVVAGYPFTNKSLPTRAAFTQRWGEPPSDVAVAAYDTVRFILSDAIKRAGTTETQAVIKALETTDVETSMARHFVFTSLHEATWSFADPNNPAALNEENGMYMTFQWQNGAQVPVYPKEIMDEAGAAYKYPPWPGPWDKKQTP
jgi:branched-chain amino acid transport system substrate-binding protein